MPAIAPHALVTLAFACLAIKLELDIFPLSPMVASTPWHQIIHVLTIVGLVITIPVALVTHAFLHVSNAQVRLFVHPV